MSVHLGAFASFLIDNVLFHMHEIVDITLKLIKSILLLYLIYDKRIIGYTKITDTM